MYKITMYSNPTCPSCQMARELFDVNGVDYMDIDISFDPGAAREMIEKTGQTGTPVIFFEREEGEEEIVVVGFDEERIKKLLDIE